MTGFTAVAMNAVGGPWAAAGTVATTSPVFGEFTFTYGVSGKVFADLTLAYGIRSQVQADFGFSYAVSQSTVPVFSDLACAFQVAEPEHAYFHSTARTYVVAADECTKPIPSFKIAVRSKLDYSFDWSQYLAVVDDAIASYRITGPAGLMLSGSRNDGGVTTVWVRPLAGGYTHRIECEITTEQGRTDTRTMELEVVAQR